MAVWLLQPVGVVCVIFSRAHQAFQSEMWWAHEEPNGCFLLYVFFVASICVLTHATWCGLVAFVAQSPRRGCACCATSWHWTQTIQCFRTPHLPKISQEIMWFLVPSPNPVLQETQLEKGMKGHRSGCGFRDSLHLQPCPSLLGSSGPNSPIFFRSVETCWNHQAVSSLADLANKIRGLFWYNGYVQWDRYWWNTLWFSQVAGYPITGELHYFGKIWGWHKYTGLGISTPFKLGQS